MPSRPPPRAAANPEHATESATPARAGTAAAAPRVGTAWARVGLAILIAVALAVFVSQNTRGVVVSVQWVTTNALLAVALLIGAAGAILLTLVLSTARGTRHRR